MKIEVMHVTPELAAEWLKNNTHNRNLNERLVEDYARAMTAGEWHLNGEAVKISEDGTLLDGQHRLAALVRAGIGLEMVVVEDLPLEVQDTMDTGRRRSASDVFSMHGAANASVAAAVARRVWHWDHGAYKFPNNPNPSPQELLAVLDKYPSIARSAEIGARTSMSFRPSRAAVTGTAHHLFLQVDPDTTAQFFASFASGVDLPNGHPVLALRNRITQDKLMSKRVPFHLGVALFIRAWNGVREGRDLARLQHTAEEPMPMPV